MDSLCFKLKELMGATDDIKPFIDKIQNAYRIHKNADM
jgi:hypothetical protein